MGTIAKRSRGIAHLLVVLMPIPLLLLAASCGAGSGDDAKPSLDAVADRLGTSTRNLNFGWTSAGGASLKPKPTPTKQAGGSAAVGNTGGTGVALRSDCLDSARSGGAWANDTSVTVLESGADKCAGWSRVQSGGAISWVRDQYLVGATSPAPAAGVAPQTPREAQLRPWVEKLLDAVWRLALLARGVPGGNEAPLTVTYLGQVAAEARTLSSKAEAITPPELRCERVRPALQGAADALETLAIATQRFFEASGLGDANAVERAAEAYLGAQKAMESAVNDCLSG